MRLQLRVASRWAVACIAACSTAARAPIANTSAAPAPIREDWESACRQSLAEAEAAFRRDAPKLFPPYKTLDWVGPDSDETQAMPYVQITPGRSWKLTASVSAVEDRDVTQPRWTELVGYQASYARRVGKLALRIDIQTERSSVDPVTAHPLVVEFVARMKTALDGCVSA